MLSLVSVNTCWCCWCVFGAHFRTN